MCLFIYSLLTLRNFFFPSLPFISEINSWEEPSRMSKEACLTKETQSIAVEVWWLFLSYEGLRIAFL